MSRVERRAAASSWSFQRVCDTAALLSIVLVFLHFFRPQWLLRPTQLVGGDATMHYYYAWRLHHVSLPHGRILEWSNDLLLGYPAFQYYFPLPFLLSALLGDVISFPVAFKLVLVGCMLAIPLACYACARLIGIRAPGPALTALMATVLMFMEKNRHQGFYVLDNLSGQFAGTLALALLLVFVGTWYRSLHARRAVGGLPLWLGGAVLSHAMLAPLFAVVQAAGSLILVRRPLRVLGRLGAALAVGLGVAAFWIIPFAFDTDVAVAPTITKAVNFQFYRQFIDGGVIVIHLLALQGAWWAVRRRDRRGLYLLLGTAILGGMLALSCVANYFGHLPVLDRYWPLYLLFVSLLAGYAVAGLAGRLMPGWARGVVVLAAIVAMWLRILASVSSLPAQAEANFSGLETRPAYPAYAEMARTLAALPGHDRVAVMLLYDSKIGNQLGGPFVWDILPMFIGKPVVATGTQGFYSLSFAAVNAFLYDGLLQRTPEKIDLLSELFNARYLVKSSATVTKPLTSRFTLLKTIRINRAESFQIFERRRQTWHYVEVPAFAPVRYDGPMGKAEVVKQLYKQPSTAVIPVVFSRRFAGPSAVSLDRLPAVPVDDACLVTEDVGEAHVRWTTSCPGRPHIVRVSYHPGWRARTGEPIYQVSPNFMLLYPAGARVELVYGPTWAGWLGWGVSIASVAWLAGCGWAGYRRRARASAHTFSSTSADNSASQEGDRAR